MARKHIGTPEVQPLIEALITLFFLEGSVNAMHRRLVAALGGSGAIYPNRLHALLSNDPTRAVNEQTLDVLRAALDTLEPGWNEGAAAAAAALRPRVVSAWNAIDGSTAQRVNRVASDLSLPPAVIAHLVQETAQSAIRGPSSPTSHGPRAPDWSYQDDAYRAALRTLRGNPDAKACLVIPTGGGKTRIGMRILLRILADSRRPDAVVLWITHRRFLGTQARRELQRAITEGTPDLPEDAVRLLAERVHVIMVGELARRLDEYGDRVTLVVIDEAHHAAAPTYGPAFERRPLRALLLTATPKRSDGRRIGVDEITYTINYRELFDRGVLIEPSFEDPLVVSGAGWTDPTSLEDLADYIIERAQTDFVKTIVVASRVDHVVAMHRFIAAAAARRERLGGSLLEADDVAYVHGEGSSTGARPEEYLDEFLALPRGILVTTAQMLGEGFDDPAVNAVIVTYPTSSIIQLMQAAGRCLRFTKGKTRAFIVQVKESPLAYHYEQRWLYQDISDALRPQLVDYTYNSPAELREQAARVLGAHRVAPPVSAAVLAEVGRVKPGETFSVLLSGLPYQGPAENFETCAEWNAVPVTPETRARFLHVFNDFAEVAGEAKSATEFLRKHVQPDPAPGSTWSTMRDMLTAMEYARRETLGEPYWQSTARGYRPNRGTTWLTYVTFRFEPSVPDVLSNFLADATNREDVLATYLLDVERWNSCAKIVLPLSGTLAFLLDEAQVNWLRSERERLINILRDASPYEAFGRVEAWRASLPSAPLPLQLLLRFDSFLSTANLETQLCCLSSPVPTTIAKAA